jgi:CBS domain-containing protein
MRVQRVRPSERFFVTPFFESFEPTMTRKVREYMATDILATSPEATPYEVAQAMVAERIDVMPVVDRELRVIGIVSEDDLLSRVNFPHGKVLDGLRGLFGGGDYRAEKSTAKRVEALMTREVCTIAPEDSIQEATEQMIRTGVRALPVTDGEGHMIGLITRRHILQAMLQWSERKEGQD